MSKHRAVIVGTKHPGGEMKAQVRLVPEWNSVPDSELPWAEYMLSMDYAFTPASSGDAVWVEFPYKTVTGASDTRRPLIVGAAQDAPGGIPNVAPEASGQGDTWEPDDVEGAPARPSLTSTEDYVSHRNNFLEIRTIGGGYEIANTAAGSRIGMNESGQIYMIGPADLFIGVGGNIRFVAGGDIEFVADGKVAGKASNFDFSKK